MQLTIIATTSRGANGDYAADSHCIIYIILLVRIDHVFKRRGIYTPRTTVYRYF